MPRIVNAVERKPMIWFDTYIFGDNHTLEMRDEHLFGNRNIAQPHKTNIRIPGQLCVDQTATIDAWRIDFVLSDKLIALCRRSMTFTLKVGDKPYFEVPVGLNLVRLEHPIVVPVRQSVLGIAEWHVESDFERFRDADEFKVIRVELHGRMFRDVG